VVKRVWHGGPVGGYVMNRLIMARGLKPGRFVPVIEGLWSVEVTDAATGETRGVRWIDRRAGLPGVVTKVDPR
jgi:hypothetical protein